MRLRLVLLILSFALLCQGSNLIESLNLRRNNHSITPFIVGGNAAVRNEFPWLVNLKIGRSFCGGALIDMNLVLTAAHCVYGASPGSIIVTAGDHDLRIQEDTEQILGAQSVKYHENYSGFTYANDIALITLAQNFTQTRAVKPVLLPTVPIISVTGTVAGWGKTLYNSSSASSVLMKVTVPIVNSTFCGQAYTNLTSITSNQICAGEAGKDSCQGDSGGPLICSGYPGTVCGVVSFGVDCGLPQYPGVYTKVSSYVNWINTNRNFSIIPPAATTTKKSQTTKKPVGSGASELLPGFFIVPFVALFLANFIK